MENFLLKPTGLALLQNLGTSLRLFLLSEQVNKKYYWVIAIQVNDSNETGYLTNTRGVKRHFKDVNTAIVLIKKYCTNFEDVKLEVLNNESRQLG